MTQKRGLGRGLGALIPGAGAPSGSPSSAGPSASAADAEPQETAPEGRGEHEPAPLRTRRRPADSGGAEAEGASTPGSRGARPVDMFFSGEPAPGGERERQRSQSGRELADDMAKAARERRRGTKASASTRAGNPTRRADEEDRATASGKGTGGATGSGGAKGRSGAKGAAAATGTGGAKGRSVTKGVAAAKDAAAETGAAAETKGTAASEGAEERTEKAKSTSAGSARSVSDRTAEPTQTPAGVSAPEDDAPVVDVEPGTRYPARPSADQTATQESNAEDTAVRDESSADGGAARDDASADGPVAGDGAPKETAADAGAAVDGARAEESAENETVHAAGADGAENTLVPVPGAQFAEIPIHEIRENPRNPRTMFDEDALDELAYSLREVGVLQPVVVRAIPRTPSGEAFELVMGERRWRAAQRAGLTAIPAIVRETTDDDLLRDALLENLHRSELNPLEEAAAYQQLLDDFNCTQDELAERIGRSRPQISNTLRLMRLPAVVQRRVAAGALSAGHARALLGLEDPALMEELASRVVAEGLSVRQVEKLVATGASSAGAKTPPRRNSYNPQVVAYTSRLSTQLEAPVKIDMGKRKGRITMEFTDLQDLERLMDRLGLADD